MALGLSARAPTVGVRLGMGIGTLLASLLFLGIFFSSIVQSMASAIEYLVTLQDPKADATYAMKIHLIDTSFAVLSYLQDRERQYLMRIANDRAEFGKSYNLYMEMTQTRDEKQSGKRLAKAYALWMGGIRRLVYLRDAQYEKTHGALRDLDGLAQILNRKVKHETKQWHLVPSRKLEETAEMEIAIADLHKNIALDLANPQMPYEPRIRQDVQDFEKHLKTYKSLSLTPEEERWTKNLRRAFSRAKAASWDILGLTKAEIQSQDAFERLRRQMSNILNDQIQLPLEKSRALARERLQKKLSHAVALVFAFVLAVMLFGLCVAVVTTKSITDPVARLIAGTETAARGNLAYRVDIKSRDELGKLAQSFNRMLEALQTQSQELRRSNEALEEFGYATSHDLQEPLRKIANYTELLEHRCRDQVDATSRGYMATIIGASTRMITLIRDLLSYARISQDELALADVDMNAAVEQALSDLETAIRERSAVVSKDRLPSVLANPGQMQELFQNLISNAVKFQGSQPPRIHISAKPAGGAWQFAVQDNGVGIDPEQTERIFLVFQRLHSKMDYPGTGIGLAICRKIVERHGGRIWVESEVGKGSAFYFTMPMPQKETP